MSNKNSENILGFTFKAVIIAGVLFFIGKSLIDSNNKASNKENNFENTETIESDSYTDKGNVNSSGFDARVPICPAKPDGAKVAPGAGYLFDAEEHVNCKDYCLVDREKELQNKLDAQRREQRIQYMERQLNN